MAVIIVAGSLQIDPDQREAFLVRKVAGMRATRAETGCLEYTFSADPTNPDRVMIMERWSSQEDLDAHWTAAQARRAVAGTSDPPTVESIFVYDVTAERPLEATTAARPDAP
jgi:quinol monooxygenase YgiN